MNVCILTTSFPAYDGDSQSPFVYRSAKSLADNKIDVEVVCPFYKNSNKKDEVLDGVKIKRFHYFIRRFQTFTEVGSIPDAVKSFYGIFQLPFFCFSFLFKAIIVGKRADIVHAQWIIPSAFVAIILKKFYGKPLIVTTRGSELVLSSKNSFWRFFLKYTLKHCDAITSNNHKHLDLLKSLGYDSNKLFYVPNGLDYNLFKKRNKKLARQKLGLSQNDKLVLFVGHLIEIKQVDKLIGIMPSLIRRNKNIKLIIVGNGPLRADLLCLVKQLNISNYVFFIGDVPPFDVPVYMNASDVLVLISKFEGRPNVVLEAMASHLPVVTTAVGDIKSFIKDGKNGFIINADYSEDFSNKVFMVLSNKISSMPLNALKTVKKIHPSWYESGLLYHKIYSSLIKQ